MSEPVATTESLPAKSNSAETNSAGPTVGQCAARGVLWTFTQVFGSKVLVALAQVALGWLLVKEDFGQIGLAFTVTTFINLLTAPGIDTVLVQRQKKIGLWITPAAWMSLALGLGGAAVTLAAAPLAAAIYQTPQVAGLVAVLALAAPAAALAVTPRAMLEAQMRYRRIAAITLTGTLVSSTLSVLLAYLGWGAYSLVAPVVVAQVIVTSLYWWQVRPPIRLRPHLRVWRYMIGDTTYVFLSRLAITIVGQADYVVLGLMYSDKSVVGVYFFAFWYASQGVRLVGAAFSNTLFSAFSKLQSEPQRQVDAALRCCGTVALVCVPVSLLQVTTAGPLFHALFGTRWDEAIPLVQLLSLGFASDAVTWAGGALLQAQRQLRLLVQMALSFMLLFVTIVTTGAWFGSSLGVALGVAGYYFFLAPVAFYLTVRPSGVSWWRSVRVYLRPWLMGTLAFLPAALVGWLIAQHVPPAALGGERWLAAFQVLMISLTGLGIYALLAKLMMPLELANLRAKLARKSG